MPEPPRTLPTRPATVELRRTVRFLAGALPLSLMLVVALGLGAGQSSTYLLPFANRTQGLGPAATGVLLLPYVAGSVVLAPLTGRLADTIGTRAPFLAWIGAGAVAAATFALLGPSPVWILPCYVLLGGMVGSTLSLAAAQMADLAARLGRVGVGASLGGLRSAQSLGPALGPPLAGLLYVRAGFRSAFLALAAELLLALSVATFFAMVGVARERGSSGPALADRSDRAHL